MDPRRSIARLLIEAALDRVRQREAAISEPEGEEDGAETSTGDRDTNGRTARRREHHKKATRAQQHPGGDATANPPAKTEGPPSNGGPKRTVDQPPTTEDRS